MPTLYVLNPTGEYPDKKWYLNGNISIRPQVETLENMPLELNQWGTIDRYYSRPVWTLSVTGKNFTLLEALDWEKLALKVNDRIRIVLATEEELKGDLIEYSRTNVEGTNLYDITMTIDVDIPNPTTLIYLGNTEEV